MDMHFDLKSVNFFGRQCVILCQNKNGPCPLLAIANVLLLQNIIFIHSDKSIITLDELIVVVANAFVEKGLSDGDENRPRSDLFQQQLDSVLNTLPRLANGLDLNVHFTGVTDFEFTEEISVFDALDIPLLHGWVIDPQDTVTSMVIERNSSYNHLMYKLVKYQTLLESFSSTKVPLVQSAKDDDSQSDGKCNKENDDDWVESSKDNGNSSQKDNEEHPEKKQIDLSPYVFVTSEGDQRETASEHSEDKIPDISSVKFEDIAKSAIDCKDHGNASSNQDTDEDKSSDCKTSAKGSKLGISKENMELLREGEIIDSFLSSTASQLTFVGLMALHQNIRERQFAIFFRNNHFSTLFRYKDRLYLLVTDLGYKKEPSVIWELLDGIDGDTEYVDGDFIKTSIQLHSLSFSSSLPLTDSDPGPLDSVSVPIHDSVNQLSCSQSCAEVKSIADSNDDYNNHNEHAQYTNHSDMKRIDSELDPDLLFALQLQDEENENANQRNKAQSSMNKNNKIGTIAQERNLSQGSRSQSQQSTGAKLEGQGTRRLTQPNTDDNLGSSCSIC